MRTTSVTRVMWYLWFMINFLYNLISGALSVLLIGAVFHEDIVTFLGSDGWLNPGLKRQGR